MDGANNQIEISLNPTAFKTLEAAIARGGCTEAQYNAFPSGKFTPKPNKSVVSHTTSQEDAVNPELTTPLRGEGPQERPEGTHGAHTLGATICAALVVASFILTCTLYGCKQMESAASHAHSAATESNQHARCAGAIPAALLEPLTT